MQIIRTFFLAVVLFLSGVTQVFASNGSSPINLVSPKNGGKLEKRLSNYTQYGRGYVVQDLTNGVTREDGWSSKRKPKTQEFVYSFKDGNTALLNNVVIHGGTAEGKYFSKDVEVWTSLNGTDFSRVAGGKLPKARNRSITLDMGLVQAAYVKLVIKKGHRKDYWELAEFVVNGDFIEVEAPTNLVSPKNGGILERSLSNFTEYGRGFIVQDLTNGVTREDGWSSKRKPKTQEFVYSFKDGNTALLDNAIIHGGRAEGKYFSKDVEVWISPNGTQFSRIASGRLPRKSNRSITLDMGLVEAAYVKLVIKKGYRKDYWELAEFVVNGDLVDTDDPNLAPTANAGPDQTTAPGTTVFLDGSRSSDPEGDPLTYFWSLTSVPDGSGATLSDLNLVNPSFVADVFGQYIAELIVNDGRMDSAPDQVLISMDNTPPVANAGVDQTASVGDTIQLDGSSSSDVDGDVLNFSWSLTSVPNGSTASLTDANSVYSSFGVDILGQYTAELVVNDGIIDSGPDTVLINVDNTPPIANAGPDQSAIIGETIQLDGSGSSDTDGDPINYFWSLPSVPNGSSAILSDVTSVNTSFVADLPGTYVAQLIVDDGQFESGWDTTVISIDDNPRPVADAGIDQTANLGDTIQLDGSGSFDADGDLLGYFWSLIVKPETSTAELSNPDAPDPTFIADQSGTYVAQLIVADDFLESEPKTVVFTVNGLPVVSAGLDQTVTFPAEATLSGTATDDGLPVDPGVVTVKWTQMNGPDTVVFADANAPLTTASFPVVGTYVLRLTADDGELTAFDELAVTVLPPEGDLNSFPYDLYFGDVNSDAVNPSALSRNAGDTTGIIRPKEDIYLHAKNGSGLSSMELINESRCIGCYLANPSSVEFIEAYAPPSMVPRYTDEKIENLGLRLMVENRDYFIGDYNGDGIVDALVIADSNLDVYYEPDAVVLLQGTAERGVFNIYTEFGDFLTNHDIYAADIELSVQGGDGRNELVVYRGDGSIDTIYTLDEGIEVEPVISDAQLVVSAGEDQTITLLPDADSVEMDLTGSISNDGLPVAWTQISGPEDVVFADANALSTTVSFPVEGTYFLLLAAEDGELTAFDELAIRVNPPPSTSAPVVVVEINDIFVDEYTATSGIEDINLYDVFEDAETADEALNFTVESSKPSLVTGSITDGILTLNYVPDASGTATISITAKDDDIYNALSVTKTFEFSVTPIVSDRSNWYVDAIDGDDTFATGSETSPYQTLAAVLALNDLYPNYVGTGDVIYLAEGDYNAQPLKIDVIGLILEGTLTEEGEPASLLGDLTITASNAVVKNCEFYDSSLTLRNASGVLVANNVFSGSTGTSLSLIGSSNNLITYNHFSSGIDQCVELSWDDVTQKTSNANQFKSNYFTHRTSGTTSQIINISWVPNSSSDYIQRGSTVSSGNRFIDCAFEETISGQIENAVLKDDIVLPLWYYPTTIIFEDCYFKQADRALPFSEFVILEEGNIARGEPGRWRWDELEGDSWVSSNFQLAITGGWSPSGTGYGPIDSPPRVQFTDTNANGSVVETSHAAGLDADGLIQFISVFAGDDQTITPSPLEAGLPREATLTGAVSVDGFPLNLAAGTVTWTQRGGPEDVTFGDVNALTTTVILPAEGAYLFRLTAEVDGRVVADELLVIVNPPAPFTGEIDFNSTNYQVYFGDLNPDDSGRPQEDIYLHAVDDTRLPSLKLINTSFCIGCYAPNPRFSPSPTFGYAPLSFKRYTEQEIAYMGLRLMVEGEDYFVGDFNCDGLDDLLIVADNELSDFEPDALVLFQGNQEGEQIQVHPEFKWYNANLLSVQDVNGDGCDELVLDIGDDDIIYTLGAESTFEPVTFNGPLVVSAGEYQMITQLTEATLSGSVNDKVFPEFSLDPEVLAVTWMQLSGPDTVNFDNANALSTTASFSEEGTYFLRLQADYGELTAFDELAVTVIEAETGLDAFPYEVYFGNLQPGIVRASQGDIYLHPKDPRLPGIELINESWCSGGCYNENAPFDKGGLKYAPAMMVPRYTDETIADLRLRLMVEDQDYFVGNFNDDAFTDLLVFARSKLGNNYQMNASVLFQGTAERAEFNAYTKFGGFPGYHGVHTLDTLISIQDVDDDGRVELVVEGIGDDYPYSTIYNLSGEDGQMRVEHTQQISTRHPGSTEGSFRVDENGAATYSIPIAVPAGSGGVAPQISLNYSSQGGNGLLGQGWNLGGLSAISRARKTKAQDGVAEPLSWDENDPLSFNGNRLILQSGVYGKVGSTYATEIDSFVRVSILETDGNGIPHTFSVEAKDGSVSYYGADARQKLADGKVVSWALYRFQDSVGNTIDYTYTQNDGADFRIDKIYYAYGDHRYQSPLSDPINENSAHARVDFHYESRPDIFGVYSAGHYLATTQRLSHITVHNNEPTANNSQLQEIRRYNLFYAKFDPYLLPNKFRLSSKEKPYVRSYLQAVQECVGSECLPATKFTWARNQGHSFSFGSGPDQSKKIIGNNSNLLQYLPMDINGDGYLDAVWLEDDPNNSSSGTRDQRIYYAIFDKTDKTFGDTVELRNNRSGKDYTTANGINSWERLRLVPLDYNADGRMDLAVFEDKEDLWNLHLSVPTSDGQWKLTRGRISLPEGIGPSAVFMDLDSDGLADILSPERIYYLRRTDQAAGSPTIYNFVAGEEPDWAEVDKPFRSSELPSIYEKDFIPAGDFNGDGRSDIIMVDRKLELNELPELGPPSFSFYRYSYQEEHYYAMVYCGDGKFKVEKYLGTREKDDDLPDFIMSKIGEDTYSRHGNIDPLTDFIAADINGDGLSEIVEREGTTFYLHHNTDHAEDRFAEPKIILNYAGDEEKAGTQLVDMNEDGYLDFFYLEKHKNEYNQDYLLPTFLYYNPEIQNFDPTRKLEIEQAKDYTEGGRFQNYFYDATGDGHIDYLQIRSRSSKIQDIIETITTFNLYANSVTGPNNVITEIRNGINSLTEIDYELLINTDHYQRIGADTYGSDIAKFYKALNEPFADEDVFNSDTQTLAPAYQAPVLEYLAPINVVTRVEGSAPAGDTALGGAGSVDANARSAIEYFYKEAKIQAAGRGFLGFKALVTIDTQTGVRTETMYRQDWPFIQHPVRTKSYTPQGDILSIKSSEWAFVGWDPNWVEMLKEGCENCSMGTVDMGPFRPYFAKSVETDYAFETNDDDPENIRPVKNANDPENIRLVNQVLQQVTTEQIYDTFGNAIRIIVTTEGGGLSQIQVTDNDFDSDGQFDDDDLTTLNHGPTITFADGRENHYRALGRLTATRVKTARNDGVETQRESAFEYFNDGVHAGLLHKEIIEPNGAAEHTLSTEHLYDNFGNKALVSTTGADTIYDPAYDPSDESSSELISQPLVTRKVENRYDSLGRYVDETRQHVTDDVVYVESTVEARNHFGAPTRILSGTSEQVTTITYDALGRAIARSDSTGVSTNSAHLWADEVDSAYPSAPAGARYAVTTTGGDGSKSIIYYDTIAREICRGVLTFNNEWSLVTTEYDTSGRVLRVSEPHADPQVDVGASKYWTQNTYDILGRVVATTHPDESETTFRYTGYTTSITNAHNQTTQEIRNGLGELVEVIDNMGCSIQYEYTDKGELKTSTVFPTEIGQSGAADSGVDKPIEVSLTYDAIGRKISMSDPDKGDWHYRYNAFGELKWQRDSKGQVVVNSYDNLGRMVRRTDYTAEGCTENVTQWYYDEADDEGTAIPYAQLQATAVVHRSAEPPIGGNCQALETKQILRYHYGKQGRIERTDTLLREVEGAPLEQYSTYVKYDDLGRVSQTRDVLSGLMVSAFGSNSDNTPLVSGIQNHYRQDNGYLEYITDLASGREINRINVQNLRGQVEDAILGGTIARNANFEEDTGRIARQSAYFLSTEFMAQEIHYTWDELGNLTSRNNRSAKVGNFSGYKNLHEQFCYDDLNRLVKARFDSLPEGQPAPVNIDCSGDIDVTYNSVGNILSKSGVNGVYSYGAGNAGPHALTQVGDITYNYDANGNMTGDSEGRELKYTSFDKPYLIQKGDHIAKFSYGADRGRFLHQEDKGNGELQTTVYLGNVEKIIRSTGTIEWKRYIGDAIITYTTDNKNAVSGLYPLLADETYEYVLRDHLGSVDVILRIGTDEMPSIIQSMSFDPWGQRRNAESWNALDETDLSNFDTNVTTRGFTDHEMLDEVGLIHMNGRVYDPRLGRFLQADPFIQAASFTQSYNRYSYAWNNPLNATDPSGYIIGLLVDHFFYKALPPRLHQPFNAIVTLAVASTGCVPCAITVSAYTSAQSTYATSGDLSLALKSGAISGISSAAFHGIGVEFGAITDPTWVTNTAWVVSHGVVGGITAEFQGGEFAHGFASAGLGKLATISTGPQGLNLGVETEFLAATVAGGTASVLSGGKFANGAVTAAYGFALNRVLSNSAQKQVSREDEIKALQKELDWLEDLNKLDPEDAKAHRAMVGLTGNAEDELILKLKISKKMSKLKLPGGIKAISTTPEETSLGVFGEIASKASGSVGKAGGIAGFLSVLGAMDTINNASQLYGFGNPNVNYDAEYTCDGSSCNLYLDFD